MAPLRGRFLNACRRQPVDCTPVWLMRQAGRYQPEYRALRSRHSMLEICTTPELAAEVTLMPLRRFDLDAAILFSDLTIPFTAMGAPFALKESVGPVVESPVRSARDVERLRMIEPEEDLAYVLEAIRILRRELAVPLIGFTGAPFTWAAYLIEGSGSRDFRRTRAFMYSEPATWHRLMEILAENIRRYLAAQIEAGAQAVQVFDSWVGLVPSAAYQQYIQPHMRSVFEGLAQLDAPVIHFGTGTGAILEDMRDAGGDVIGVDWRTPLDQARARLGTGVAVMGNLDPAVLAVPSDRVGTLESEVRRVLRDAGPEPGYIFNLGHGILPDTPPENVSRLVDLVHGS